MSFVPQPSFPSVRSSAPLSQALPPPSPPPSVPFSLGAPIAPYVPDVPVDATPPTCEVPHFAPVRVRGGGYALSRLVRHRRRAVAAGLAVTAAALVAAGPRDADRARGHPGDPAPPRAAAPATERPVRVQRAAGLVTAPVRIADAATVRLLRPGDRVDVIAAGEAETGGAARVVARGARVSKVPESVDDPVDVVGSGALVVLSVPRSTAARLAGASATARLAVTLW